MIAMIHEECGNPLLALEFFVLAAEYTPKDPGVWERVAEKARELRQFGQALTHYDRVITRNERCGGGDDPNVQFRKMTLLVEMGNVKLAKTVFHRYLDRWPERYPGAPSPTYSLIESLILTVLLPSSGACFYPP